MSAPEKRALALGETGEIDTGYRYLACIRRVDSADKIEKCRLSRTAAAAQCDDLAATEIRIDVIQHAVFELTFPETATDSPKRYFCPGIRQLR